MKINLLMEAFSIAHQRGQHDIAKLIWDACGRIADSEEPAPQAPAQVRRAPAAQPAAKQPAAPAASNGHAKGKGSPAQDLVLNILSQFGPLTTAEVSTHAYPKQKDSKKAVGAAYAVLQDLRRKGLAERREEESTHLDKWFATRPNRKEAR